MQNVMWSWNFLFQHIRRIKMLREKKPHKNNPHPPKKPNQKKKKNPTKTWLWIGRIIKCCLQQYLYTKSGTRWLIDTFIYLLIGNFSLPEFFFSSFRDYISYWSSFILQFAKFIARIIDTLIDWLLFLPC